MPKALEIKDKHDLRRHDFYLRGSTLVEREYFVTSRNVPSEITITTPDDKVRHVYVDENGRASHASSSIESGSYAARRRTFEARGAQILPGVK